MPGLRQASSTIRVLYSFIPHLPPHPPLPFTTPTHAPPLPYPTIPVIHIGHRDQPWSEAPEMIRHVALVAENLFVRTILPSTHTASAVLALPSRVILTPITIRLLHARHALPIRPLPLLLPRTTPGLNTENLIHKFHLHLLRGVRELAAG